jgi:hypothetical protein
MAFGEHHPVRIRAAGPEARRSQARRCVPSLAARLRAFVAPTALHRCQSWSSKAHGTSKQAEEALGISSCGNSATGSVNKDAVTRVNVAMLGPEANSQAADS